MTYQESEIWKATCRRLIDEYPYIHFFYSSSEGWCYASYKEMRQKLTYRMSNETILQALAFLQRNNNDEQTRTESY